ncbi:DEAD/DEAH box helicase [Conchiformibius steedae]|uniref:DNA helicase n=1 Tax=Conchiformibius steedae TaxID=153493 RepID=A0A3P2A890_9NEIS|nr:AAA domain-containing protein [Conchiformibius steedae]RRD91637.1 DNA helicase [Conchiformibius steedae]
MNDILNNNIKEENDVDFIEHLNHWLEYLSELYKTTDEQTKPKLKRQMRCLLEFYNGVNCNIHHNFLLQHYYSYSAKSINEDIFIEGMASNKKTQQNSSEKVKKFVDELKQYSSTTSTSIVVDKPIQQCYQTEDSAFQLISKALVSNDLFFMQGPPGTGKTTAIVEIILQQLKARSDAKILVTSETHVAVDNALDRLAAVAPPKLRNGILRYPRFSISEFESDYTEQTAAIGRADILWHRAYQIDSALTSVLWKELEPYKQGKDDNLDLPYWQARNLAEMHQVVGVTCNQIAHLRDTNSPMFDLAIVDECSKATMPEWLMAMSIAQKCILVGDHKQLPPTFCTEASDVLDQMEEYKGRLIRNGVIDRLFENLPSSMKGTLGKQYRMLPEIGQFVSQHFYQGQLEHHRIKADHGFCDFGWLNYHISNYRVPMQLTGEKKVLVNHIEVEIIMKQLSLMSKKLKAEQTGRKLSVALITPYKAQRKALRDELKNWDFSSEMAIEVDTVDAFQGRQADVVFFSFVRNIGPATFYADDRRLNVAISRARDSVYFVGDMQYLKSKKLPVLDSLMKLPVLREYFQKTRVCP